MTSVKLINHSSSTADWNYLLSVGENKNFFSVYRGNKQLNAGKRKLAPYLQNVAHLKPV